MAKKSEIKIAEYAVVAVSELRAALLFASTDDDRFVLTGVCLEIKQKSAPMLVTTDGRRLSVIETCAEQPGLFEKDYSVVLHPDFVKGIIALSKTQSAWIGIEVRPGGERVIIHFIGKRSTLDVEKGATIEATYPAWRAVIPTGEKQPVTELAMNAVFIGDYAKAAKLLGTDEQTIRMNIFSENSAIEVRIPERPNFYGVVMPAKTLTKMEFQPEFLGLGFTNRNGTDEPKDDTIVTIKAGSESVSLTTEQLAKAAKEFTGKSIPK